MKSPPLRLVVVVAALLVAPTLAMGFYADDFFHQILLTGSDTLPDKVPFGLFDFGTFAEWSRLEGTDSSFPWWTGTDWRARFLRPFSSLFLTVLHGAFGATPWPYHVVGVVLHLSMIALAHGLYLQLGLSRRAAGLGTLLLATSDAAVIPVGWTANHNSVLVAIFALIAVRAISTTPLRAGSVLLALSSAAMAALSKESGSATFVLILITCAVRLRNERERTARRHLFAAAFGACALIAMHAAWFLAAGYGSNSQFYADPSASPARFLSNELVLFSAGLASMGGPLPLDALTMFPALRPLAIGVGALLAWPICVWVLRTLEHSWCTLLLLLWTVGFLALQAGVAASDRLLYVPMVGAAGLLGHFFELQAQRRAAGEAPLLARYAARALLLSATLGSGGFLFVQGAGMVGIASYLRESAVAADVGPADLGRRDVLVLQAESQMQAFTTAFTHRFLSTDSEVVFWNLQASSRPLRWTRTSARSFELESLGEPFLNGPFELLYLTSTPGFQVGDRWSTRLFEVEALGVERGLPTHLSFEFERDLEDPSLRFVRSELGVLSAFPVPGIGTSIELPRPSRTGPWMP